ncbi:MAG: hypothetical protein HRT47_04100 [Candidatus Caenarcaniphilales bacterium]|nr:hypothetical protein [Candidatus Caenarcaniphilales bacterium]
MPSYCTVCGVKLTAKNRISYRPSSCRDCELERKRLYSLKRKLQKEQENEAKGGKTTKTKVKEEKKTTKTKVVKGTSATKAKIVTKTPTKTKAATKATATRAKRSTTKAATSKATTTKAKAAEKETKAKTATKAKAATAKTKAVEKETKAKTTTKAKAEEVAKKTKETPKKEETKAKAKATAKSKAAPEKKEANPFVALPSYIKDSAKTKVKKRRLSKDKKSSSASAKELPSLSSEGDASHIFALGKELTEDDLLRAPSETPWDSSSFKIVNGSFVEHGAEDQEESRGPSPEEIKNIIEKIRLEHKTRRS